MIFLFISKYFYLIMETEKSSDEKVRITNINELFDTMSNSRNNFGILYFICQVKDDNVML